MLEMLPCAALIASTIYGDAYFGYQAHHVLGSLASPFNKHILINKKEREKKEEDRKSGIMNLPLYCSMSCKYIIIQ